MALLRGWVDARGEAVRFLMATGIPDLLAALRHDRIEAPWLLDGPINAEGFKAYVEKVLVPTLRPGDLLVIMDNLGSHKGKAVRRAIRSAGFKLFFLPKYSPDLNPSELLAFAKLKHLCRKAAAVTPKMKSRRSANCSTTPRNAPTTSQTPDTGKPKTSRSRRGAKPWLEGAYALRQRLSRGHQVHSAVRLSQATRPCWAGKGQGARLRRDADARERNA